MASRRLFIYLFIYLFTKFSGIAVLSTFIKISIDHANVA